MLFESDSDENVDLTDSGSLFQFILKYMTTLHWWLWVIIWYQIRKISNDANWCHADIN